MSKRSPARGVSRRDFLLAGGAVVVGFSLGSSLPRFVLAQSAATSDLGKPLDPHQVDSFLAFHADGSVTIYTSKVDVGTGLRIAMSQMAAEELGVPVERISIVEGDTALVPDHGGTGGSTGIPRGAVDVRQAAATARQAILDLGATQLKRPASELTITGGTVRAIAGGSGVSIGKLIGGKRLNLAVDAKATLKDPSDLHHRRQAPAATRRSGQVHRKARVRAGPRRAEHAARPRDPSAGHRREARFRR